MTNVEDVVNAAERLHDQKDEAGLELLIGMRTKAIEQNPALRDNIEFEPAYEDQTMGALDDIRGLGKRILNRWNKELYTLVCVHEDDDQKARRAILGALNLGEAAVIGAVATALLTLGVAAAIAAALAPLIVKRFIWPAKDELCQAWGEGVKAQG